MLSLVLNSGEKIFVQAGAYLSLAEELADEMRNLLNEYKRGNLSQRERDVLSLS